MPQREGPTEAPLGARDERQRAAPEGRKWTQSETNSIRAARTRARTERKTDSNTRGTDSTRAGADTPAVPPHIQERYLRVGRHYHFETGEVAFVDRIRKLTTELENTEVIGDLLAIAQARGWESITTRGTAHFRRETWQQAQALGITVRGYRASDLERAQLARRLGRERAREEGIPETTEKRDAPARPAPERPPNATANERPSVRPDRLRDRIQTGILIDQGPAPYHFDRRSDPSYYVRLETSHGEETLWGKDLERAAQESLSGVAAGDEVTVRRLGARPVTVTRARRDEEGRVVQERQVQTHLNRWSIERTDFLAERAELAELVRDSSIDAKAAAAQRPELVGTYTELQAAKLVATELYAHAADRERFLARVREAIADEIERGEPLSPPRARQERKAPAPPPRTPERIVERVR